MSQYSKVILVTALYCCFNLSTFAADRFLISYRLSEAQESYLACKSGPDKYAEEERIKVGSLENLLDEKKNSILQAASFVEDIEIVNTATKSSGSLLVILNQDLDEHPTEIFIQNVKGIKGGASIEEDIVCDVSSWLMTST